MTREEFLLSIGAQFSNRNWSWSAVNHEKKWVIFGAWDVHTKNGREMILSEDWQLNSKGKKRAGYTEAYKNIQLIEEKKYQLKTYTMILDLEGNGGHERAKIKEFIPELHDRKLSKSGDAWYALDENLQPSLFPDEEGLIVTTETDNGKYIEGAVIQTTVNAYERSAAARKKCIEHYGCSCVICDLNFEQLYGDLGKGFIHVHHIVPLSEINSEYELDPIKDLIPVCPNCHAMIHQTKPIKNINEMRRIISIGRRNTEAGIT